MIRKCLGEKLHENRDIGNSTPAANIALVRQVRSCSAELTRSVAVLFEDYNSAALLADRVGGLESRADDLEFELIDKIFSSRRETAEKILLRDMTQAIGSIADRAENAADRVRIVAIKRKI